MLFGIKLSLQWINDKLDGKQKKWMRVKWIELNAQYTCVFVCEPENAICVQYYCKDCIYVHAVKRSGQCSIWIICLHNEKEDGQ